jgi:hypothetical protein
VGGTKHCGTERSPWDHQKGRPMNQVLQVGVGTRHEKTFWQWKAQPLGPQPVEEAARVLNNCRWATHRLPEIQALHRDQTLQLHVGHEAACDCDLQGCATASCVGAGGGRQTGSYMHLGELLDGDDADADDDDDDDAARVRSGCASGSVAIGSMGSRRQANRRGTASTGCGRVGRYEPLPGFPALPALAPLLVFPTLPGMPGMPTLLWARFLLAASPPAVVVVGVVLALDVASALGRACVGAGGGGERVGA